MPAGGKNLHLDFSCTASLFEPPAPHEYRRSARQWERPPGSEANSRSPCAGWKGKKECWADVEEDVEGIAGRGAAGSAPALALAGTGGCACLRSTPAGWIWEMFTPPASFRRSRRPSPRIVSTGSAESPGAPFAARQVRSKPTKAKKPCCSAATLPWDRGRWGREAPALGRMCPGFAPLAAVAGVTLGATRRPIDSGTPLPWK